MESILELPVSSMVVALVQAHSHKKLTGFSQTAEICHERSSQAPGVGLGRNCRSLSAVALRMLFVPLALGLLTWWLKLSKAGA